MNLRPPNSQKVDARPISFVLDDNTSGGEQVSFDLAIRPEDLKRTDPSRMNIQQTLGGAWADNFGPGITQIVISGHTGWRRKQMAQDQLDGGEQFQLLFDTVFTKWHTLRNDAVKAGQNPDLVRLLFVDALDNIVAVVAPTMFTLSRSKSQPLLSKYQIMLMVLTTDIDSGSFLDGIVDNLPGTNDAMQSLGLDSMTASIGRLKDFLGGLRDVVDQTMVLPSREFLIKTIALYEATADAIRTGDEIAASLVGVARMTAQAGANIFRTINAAASLPNLVRTRLMQISSEYTNILCVLSNAVQQQQFYPDYNPLFGSSNCSSTNGGGPMSPLSGVNPFYLYAPNNRQLPVTITSSSNDAFKIINGSDVALAPMSTSQLSGAVRQAADGMVVA